MTVPSVRQRAQIVLERQGIDAVTVADPVAYARAYADEDPTVFLLHALALTEAHMGTQLMVAQACLSGLVSAHDDLRLKSARQSAGLLDLKTQLSTAAKQLNSHKMAALVRDAPLGQPYGLAKEALPTGTAIVKTIRAQIALQEESK